MAKRLHAELLEHVGGNPSATLRALISQIVQLQLRLHVMDEEFAAAGGMTLHDSRMYLAWSNTCARMMLQLGLKPAARREPSLSDYLQKSAQRRPAPRANGHGTDTRQLAAAASEPWDGGDA